MKTKFLFFIIGLFGLLEPISAQSNTTLEPSDITIDGGNPQKEWAVVNYLGLKFTDKIKVAEDAKCYIYDGDNVVSQSISYTYWPYDFDKLKTDEVNFMFEGTETLPLGKTYKIVVPAGTICLQSDNSVTTGDIIVDFVMPEKATCTGTMMDFTRIDGTTGMYPMESENYFAFVFGMTMDYSFSGGNMTLYREGMPIMEFPVKGGGDQSFGTATSMFGRRLNFEQGVNYSFVLPENSVKSRYHEGLFNAEARRDFVGAYSRTFVPIVYESCDVQNMLGIRQLSLVNVKYTTPIALAPQARLQLLDAEGNVLKEANATLTESGDAYTLTADFGGETLEPSAGYMLCIPEATVVGTGQDITVNSRNLIPLNGYEMSVGDVETKAPRLSLIGDDLRIDNVSRGDRIVAYGPCGTLLMRTIATEGGVIAQLPHGTSLCIVNINGKAYKVMRK